LVDGDGGMGTCTVCAVEEGYYNINNIAPCACCESGVLRWHGATYRIGVHVRAFIMQALQGFTFEYSTNSGQIKFCADSGSGVFISRGAS